jgi:purine-binding chemotaxis protein CheW
MTDEPGPIPEPTSLPPAQALRILQDRARLLARPLNRPEPPDDLLHIVEFRLRSQYFAIERAHIREVHPLKNLTPLPCTPDCIAGIVNVRGQILPALDLQKFFGQAPQGITDLHVVIIVEGAGLELGILADAVESAQALPQSALRPRSEWPQASYGQFVKAVTQQGVLILDAQAILSDKTLVVNEEVEMPAAADSPLAAGDKV